MVSRLLMFFGYLLVYAAVAAGGKFATEPWAGLFADAYTETSDPRVTSRNGGPKQSQGTTIQPGTYPKGGQVAPRTGVGKGYGGTRGIPGGRA